MPRLTIVLGALLLLLGIGAFAASYGSENQSVTALIPAFFGLPIALLGAAAVRWPARRALTMHIAVLLALLGFLGAARGLLAVPTLLSRPDEVARPTAVIVQSVMALVCLVYVILAVRSFIIARRSGQGDA